MFTRLFSCSVLVRFLLTGTAISSCKPFALAAGSAVVSPDIPMAISVRARHESTYPAIASNGEMFLDAWQWYDENAGRFGVRLARRTPDGRILDPGGVLLTNLDGAWLQKPGIGSDGTNFFVAWRIGHLQNTLGGVLLSPSGRLFARTTLQSPTTARSSDTAPAIAFDGTNYLLVWEADRNYALLVSALDLSVVKGPVQLSDNGSFCFPAAVWNGENFVVAWKLSDGAYVSRLSSDGTIIDSSPLHFPTGSQPAQRVALASSGEQLLLAWDNSAVLLDHNLSQLESGIVTLNGTGPSAVWNGTNFLVGTASGAAVAVDAIHADGTAASGTGATFSSNILRDSVVLTMGSGTATVVYSGAGSYSDVYGSLLKSYSVSGAPAQTSPGTLLSIRPLDEAPAVTAFGDGDLLAWSGLFTARVDASGQVIDPDGRIPPLAADELEPAMALGPSGALTVWSVGWNIRGSLIYNNGTMHGGNELTDTRGRLLEHPSVAASASKFLLAWEEDGHAVIANRVTSYGAPDSLPVTLFSAPSPEPAPAPPDSLSRARFGFLPKVASDGSDYLVVWNSPRQPDGSVTTQSRSAIYASRVSAGMVALDPEPIQVSPGTACEWSPAVAWTPRAYLVAWLQKSDPASPYSDIAVAPVFPNGGSGPVRVIASGPRRRTSVSLAPNGTGFLAVWREVNDEFGTSDIICASLNPDGTLAADGVFTVASGRICSDPGISADNHGALVATETYGPDTYNIIMNRVEATATPIAPVDSTTEGDWQTRYSGGDYWIAGDTKKLGTVGQITVEDAQSWLWTDNTPAPSALERADGSGRVAGCWYSPDTFDVHIQFNDSAEHEIAFYFIDWDTYSRAQLIQVFDNSTGELLRNQYLSSFHDGEYWTLVLRGDVRVRFTRAAGNNAVLSGIFLPSAGGPAGQAAAPVIQPNGGTFNSMINVTLSSVTPGASIYYTKDGTAPGTNSSLYDGPIVLSESTVLKAIAVKDGLLDSDVAEASFTRASADTNAPVQLVARDTATQGSWPGKYGGDGYIIFGDSQKLPAYAEVTLATGGPWTWNDAPADPAALERGTDPASRIAACVYSADTVEVRINLPLGEKHQIALYCLDWDTSDRRQSVTVLQNDSSWFAETISRFHNGEYLVWNVNGPVTIQARLVAGYNAVISGIFFDTPAGETPEAAATPEISPSPGTFTAPVQVSMTTSTPGAAITYTLDGTTPESTSTAYTGPFTLDHSANVSARAFADGFSPSPAASAVFTIEQGTSSGAAASFDSADNVTEGSWRGTFGNAGYIIAKDSASIPASTTVTLSGQNDHIWAYGVSDPPALQMADASGRIASCWYAADQFEIALGFSGSDSHRVSLYFLDWDNAGRAERVQIFDAGSNTLLDSREISGFQNGLWQTWKISGAVRIRVTRAAGPNAVLSGLFFD